MPRKTSKATKTGILTFPGEDGAAAAALILTSIPEAKVFMSSKSAIAGVLQKLSGMSLQHLHICGVGIPPESLDAVVATLKHMKQHHTKVTWYCGYDYIDEFRSELEPYCTCEFSGDSSPMPELLFRILYPDNPQEESLQIIRFVGTQFATQEDVPSEYQSSWKEAEQFKTLIQASIRRWLNFANDSAYLHAIRVLAGQDNLRVQDQNMIKLFKIFHRTYLKGRSTGIERVREMIRKCGPAEVSILITGETGTGKEIVAKLIHEASSRAEDVFASVNCANLKGTLLQDHLFGHVKGAYSGAERDRIGLFEIANGGSLFLDEIGEMPLETQAELLRVFQEGQFYRLGEEKPRTTDVRVIAATNRNLLEEVRKGNFREDLFYRLAVINIELPPLRQRVEDIPILARHILYEFCRNHGYDQVNLTQRQEDHLKSHSWPGNVRELENVLQRMVLLQEKNLSKVLTSTSEPTQDNDEIIPLEEYTNHYIQSVYMRLDQNITRTAEALGISRNTLRAKIKTL